MERKETYYVYDQRVGRKRRHDPWFASQQSSPKRQQPQPAAPKETPSSTTATESESSNTTTISVLESPNTTTISVLESKATAEPEQAPVQPSLVITSTGVSQLESNLVNHPFDIELHNFLPHAIEVVPQLDFSSPPFPFDDNATVTTPSPLSPLSPASGSSSDEDIACEYWNELTEANASKVNVTSGKEECWSLQEEIDWCLDLLT